MNTPGATGEITGEPRSSRLNSPATKKCVAPLEPIGPESDTSLWPSESLAISFPLAALAVVKPASAAAWRRDATVPSLRRAICCRRTLVMMLMTLPVLPPYSAENALVSTPISCTASRGMLLKIVWRPQLSLPLLPSTSNHAWRRPAPLVVNRSSFMKTSPWLMAGRLAAFSSGRKVMRWLAAASLQSGFR